MDNTKLIFNSLKIFLKDKDEQIVAVLGQKYIKKLVFGRTTKSIFILTDSKIYQIGRLLGNMRSGMVTFYKQTNTIPIKDIVGHSIIRTKNHGILVAFIICLICIFLFNDPAHLLDILFIMTSIVLFFLYLFKPRKVFLINYAGGTFKANAKWYSKKEILAFHAALGNVNFSGEKMESNKMIFNNLTPYLKEKDEKIVAVLGQKNIKKLVFGERVKGMFILTDKWLYQKGKLLKKAGDSLIPYKDTNIIPIKSITGYKLGRKKNVTYRVLFGSLFVGNILLMRFGTSAIYFILIASIIAFVSLILYFINPIKYMSIHYMGGSILTNTKWYPKSELEKFQAEIKRIQNENW